MGRPRASKKNEQLAADFSQAVTVKSSLSSPAAETVGRSGQHSVFEVFSKVFPAATREHSREGVNWTEFSKVLQKKGEFKRVRFRASTEQIIDGDIQGDTFYRFGGRRWRSPDDAGDMAVIAQVWPRFDDAASCTLAEMAQILREAIAGDIALMAKKKCRTAAQSSIRTPSEASSSVKDEFQDGPSASSAPLEAEADTDERASAGPASSHFSVDDDDEELQAKLAKEQFSAEGLPPLATSSAPISPTPSIACASGSPNPIASTGHWLTDNTDTGFASDGEPSGMVTRRISRDLGLAPGAGL